MNISPLGKVQKCSRDDSAQQRGSGILPLHWHGHIKKRQHQPGNYNWDHSEQEHDSGFRHNPGIRNLQ